MSKILQTVNLIVNAMKPKQVTWNLNKDGTEYIAQEKELGKKFEVELVDPNLKIKKTEEVEIPIEFYLTDSGIPWFGQTKEEKANAIISNSHLPNPLMEELNDQQIDELKTFRTVQETLASKLKIERIIEEKCKTYISNLTNSKFTRDELAREKKVDLETRKRLQALLEKLKPKKEKENRPQMNISSSPKCRFTKEELAREKKVDLETRKRLQALLEKTKIKKDKDMATWFDPLQGKEYYLNRYNSEPAFKDWFHENFHDYSIEKVLEMVIPVTFSKCKSSKLDSHKKNADLQKYIDIYTNEPMYQDWFDRKYPGQSIYDIVGIQKPQ